MPALPQKVVRLQAQEVELSTTISVIRSKETELHKQLPTLQQENAQLNDLMNQFHITNSSMNTRNQELTWQLQTSNLEISHKQTDVVDLRNSVERNHSTESRRTPSKLDDQPSAEKKQKGRRRALKLFGMARNMLWTVGAEGPTGVGSGDTTLLMATHIVGNTSQLTPQNLSVASAVSSSAFGSYQLTAGGDPMQCAAQSEFRRAAEACSVLSAGRGSCAKYSTEQWCPEKEKFTSSTTFVMWQMNFKSEVCSISRLPTEGLEFDQ